MTRRLPLSAVVDFVLAKVGLEEVVELFLNKQGEELPALLNRVCDDDRFGKLALKHPQLCERLAARINANLVNPRRQLADQSSFDSENVRLLERVVQFGSPAGLLSKVHFDKAALAKVQAENQGLFRLIHGPPRPQSGSHSNPKALKNGGKESEALAEPKMSEVLKSMSPPLRVELLKSLLPHIGKLGRPNVNPTTKDKIVKKTIDILHFSFEFAADSDTTTFEVALQRISALFDSQMSEGDCQRLCSFIGRIGSAPETSNQPLLCSQLVECLVGHLSVFKSVLQMLLSDSLGFSLLNFAQCWTVFLQSLRRHQRPFPFQKSLRACLKELLEVAKSRLISTEDTRKRKGGVFFLVQASFFLEKKDFEQSLGKLSSEQRALVMVYIQKESKLQ